MFDVDGTLTPARSMMDEGFRNFFLRWSEGKKFYLVSGSDLAKIKQQLPQDVMERCAGVYSSMGNSYHERDQVVYSIVYSPSYELLEDLQALVENSEYPIKTGHHVELRDGMVNFSIVGRNADMQQRAAYGEYDKRHGDREGIVETLSHCHPDLDFAIGGKISIDIYPKGYDKSQAVRHLRGEVGNDPEIIFFGDRTEAPGNDYGIVRALDEAPEPSQWHAVEKWADTMSILKESYSD
tara:strand:+ start:2815 stop:3528 length:714 start_codon:yes stop_codon:yes gene_type:complete